MNLQKTGSTYRAKSPFTNERTPSFFVVPQKNIYKDFSSGKGGDAIDFLMEAERMTFTEAVTWICNKYGIEIVKDNEKPSEKEQDYADISLALTKAHKHYMQQWATDNGLARDFMESRGFTGEEVMKFKIGFANSSWQNLQGFTDRGFFASGLVKVGETGNQYSFFRNRILFPIYAVSGKLLGFTGRSFLGETDSPKYLHSSGNVVFNKSAILYGIYWSKAHIIKTDKCYVMEGPMDYHACVRNKMYNVCSTLGTSITAEQVRQIKRFTTNITMVYDSDKGGNIGLQKAISLCLEQDVMPNFVCLPKGEDPDSLIKKYGFEYYSKFIEREDDCVAAILMVSEFNPNAGLSEQQKCIGIISKLISASTDTSVRAVLANSLAVKTGMQSQVFLDGATKQNSLKPEKLDLQDEPERLSESPQTIIEERLAMVIRYQFDSDCYCQTENGWEKLPVWKFIAGMAAMLGVEFEDARFKGLLAHLSTISGSEQEKQSVVFGLPSIVRHGYYERSPKMMFGTVVKLILDLALIKAQNMFETDDVSKKEYWAKEVKEIENTINDIYRLTCSIPD